MKKNFIVALSILGILTTTLCGCNETETNKTFTEATTVETTVSETTAETTTAETTTTSVETTTTEPETTALIQTWENGESYVVDPDHIDQPFHDPSYYEDDDNYDEGYSYQGPDYSTQSTPFKYIEAHLDNIVVDGYEIKYHVYDDDTYSVTLHDGECTMYEGYNVEVNDMVYFVGYGYYKVAALVSMPSNFMISNNVICDTKLVNDSCNMLGKKPVDYIYPSDTINNSVPYSGLVYKYIGDSTCADYNSEYRTPILPNDPMFYLSQQ